MKSRFHAIAPFLLFTFALPPSIDCHADAVVAPPFPNAEITPTRTAEPATASVQKLLKHLQQSAATEYHYQETRTLDLVDAPVHAAGYLLSGADGALIKLQESPERIVMAVTAQRMYYFNAAQGLRYSAALDFTEPMAAQIGAFRALVQGRTAELYADYAVSVEQQGSRWKLGLIGKTSHNSGLNIEVSGDDKKPARKMTIQQPDGEKTEYLMEAVTAKLPPQYSLERLLAEATGE